MNKIMSILGSRFGLLGRYIAVSVLNVVNHQILLQTAMRWWGWGGGVANGFAALVAVIPAYYLSRYWVWQVSGPSKVKAEIVPFWVIAAIGFGVSTAMAEWAHRASGDALIVSGASLLGYLIVWVLKFAVLNFLFTRSNEDPAEVLASK